LKKPSAAGHIGATDRSERQPATNRRKPGTKPRTIEEFPTPLFDDWLDPPTFREALDLHVRRHGDSYWHLHRAVVRDDEKLDHSTIRHWLQGSKAPRSVASMEVLGRIERRYRLPAGYFKAKLAHQTRSVSGHVLDDISPAERRPLHSLRHPVHSFLFTGAEIAIFAPIEIIGAKSMPGNLHVRNLDDDLISKLKIRAARHGRSAEAEHREILRQALANEGGPDFDDLAADLRKLTASRKQTSSEVLLREGRDER